MGVYIHNSLKPSVHCAKVVKKANSVLGQMSRSVHYRDKIVWLRLYKQFVRPHLEFAVQAWSPWSVADKDLLKSVQQRAIKMVSGLVGRTYEDKLAEVGLTTLETRRTRGDMIQVWKFLHAKDNIPASTWFTLYCHKPTQITRNTEDSLRIRKENVNHEFRKNFFSIRSVDHWNSLPFWIRDAENMDAFKSEYDKLVKIKQNK